MPLIPYPNVPNVPGVPALPRSVSANPIVQLGLGVLQAVVWGYFDAQARWGIYDAQGRALGDPSRFSGLTQLAVTALGFGSVLSTVGVRYSKETRVSDFPIQDGGFASYNKVELPADPVVTFGFSGSESDRSAFLAKLDAATKSVDLYNVVTPEVTYMNYSIEGYDYERRADKGVSMLIVAVKLKEIRPVTVIYTAAAKQINSPKDAGATPSVNNGKVQAATPDQSTLKKLANKFPTLVNDVSKYLGAM